MLRLTFLGTSAAQPTIGRNLTALAVRRERELFLFDCGEGTQRQMIRFGTGFDNGFDAAGCLGRLQPVGHRLPEMLADRLAQPDRHVVREHGQAWDHGHAHDQDADADLHRRPDS